MKNSLKVSVLFLAFLALSRELASFDLLGLQTRIIHELTTNWNQLATMKDSSDEDDGRFQFNENLSIFSQYKQVSLGLTLRANNFYFQRPNTTLEKTEFQFYRKFIQFQSRDLKLTAGDFYANLGRGLVFSVMKNDDVLRDRTILGGDVSMNKGRLSLRGFGGHLQNELQNEEWFVAGGEWITRLGKDHYLGVHGSFVDDIDTSRLWGRRYAYSFSWQKTKLLKYLSFYGEGAILNFADQTRQDGHGLYGSMVFQKNHWMLNAEFKKYYRFNNEVNNAPISDREEQFANLYQSIGGRLLCQYSFLEPDIALFVNYGVYEEYEATGEHVFGGITAEDLWERLTFSFTFGVRSIEYAVKKYDGNLIYRISDRLSATVTLKGKEYEQGNLHVREQDMSLELACSPWISVYGLYQYSLLPVLDLNHFWSGGVKVYISDVWIISVSGGTLRGGSVCAGGQCNYVPPFKGVKVSVFANIK